MDNKIKLKIIKKKQHLKRLKKESICRDAKQKPHKHLKLK